MNEMNELDEAEKAEIRDCIQTLRKAAADSEQEVRDAMGCLHGIFRIGEKLGYLPADAGATAVASVCTGVHHIVNALVSPTVQFMESAMQNPAPLTSFLDDCDWDSLAAAVS